MATRTRYFGCVGTRVHANAWIIRISVSPSRREVRSSMTLVCEAATRICTFCAVDLRFEKGLNCTYYRVFSLTEWHILEFGAQLHAPTSNTASLVLCLLNYIISTLCIKYSDMASLVSSKIEAKIPQYPGQN